MAPIPTLSRSLAAFILCAVFFQLILFFKSGSGSTSDFGAEDDQHSSFSFISSNNNNHHRGDRTPPSSSGWNNDPVRNRHPTVPLTLQDLQTLDELSDKIAMTEARRVFGHKNSTGGIVFANNIFGTKIKNDLNHPEDEQKARLVDKVRDQIRCWTTHGKWVRQDKEFTPIRHLGDSRFAKCDKTFMKSLDREGNGHYLGEYDHVNDRFMVREAVKYRWVPDETICGPGEGPTKIGLKDDRAIYQPFTKQGFCEIMERRNMLVVGDLTQYQIHDVIVSAFNSTFVCYGELGCLHHSAHGLCPGVAVKYARNDILSVPWAVNPEDEEYPSASTVEQPWGTPDMLLTYKVLILNKGLLWRPDEVFMSELVFTMKQMWRYYPETLVIYRATHPVSNCTLLKAQGEDEAIADKNGDSIIPGTTIFTPLEHPPKRQVNDQQENTSNIHQEFRPTMADIQRQNRMAKTIVEAAGGIYLDTEEMFAMRPDGRMGDGDCSRFCAPGPLDAYADLFYNTFRVLQV
ncbi:hypothetical protein BG004_002876 [Podila humilis]|nr:hypothetical protein BG004_002876 [Podila humilis]